MVDDIREFTDAELRAELERREIIRNSNWPKKKTIVLVQELGEDDEFCGFLYNECGFNYESDEVDHAINGLLGTELELEVNKDGTVNVATVNGYRIDQNKVSEQV